MTNKKNFYCERCEENKPFKIFDGYWFGDRLLEDVFFKLYPDGKIETQDDWTKGYFKGLNYEFWLLEAKKSSTNEDLICLCPDCKELIDD